MSPDRGKSRSGGIGKQGKSAGRSRRNDDSTTTPVGTGDWTIRPVSQQVHKQWDAAIAAEPDLMTALRTRLRTRPLDRSDNPRRTGKLHGDLGRRRIGDASLSQWQHEITGAGRVWYCPETETRTGWVTRISFAHPKATE